MSRRKPELQAIDVSAWPTVAYTELDGATRRTFELRRQAVLRYTAGESIKAIEKSTGINRRQLYRWLERAQTPHPDGRPFGFRALIRYMRIAEYGRVRDVHVRGGARQPRRIGRSDAAFRALPHLDGMAATSGQTVQGAA
ncbi:helix-turn-helix domain-containing protein [Burkholderia ubonensis]|uniref:helix-turn-helix domain-containing protein n=1 Tax=Burkholderia ubonensis TaxID=101571 RepID=UPI001E4056A7|nr:helix-turn-helix domain-containing protein [Burkholderia ubonensis]